MDSIVVACETCGQRFKAPASAVGKKTTCSFCQGEITIRAAGDADLSQAGFVDLSDDDDGDAGGYEDEVEERPRRRSRDRESFFDLAAGQAPRRGGDRGTGRRSRGGTARRRRDPEPEPEDLRGSRGGRDNLRASRGGRENLRASRGGREDLRASRAGSRGSTGAMRRSGAHRAPSSGGMAGAGGAPPWKWIGIGAGGFVLLLIVIISMAVSSANEAERQRKAEIRAAKLKKKREREARARERRRELYETYKAAKAKADEIAKKEEDNFDEMNRQRRANKVKEVPREEFRSVKAALEYVKAGDAAADAGKDDLATQCYETAITKYDPDCEPAHRLLGHKRYALPEDEKYQALIIEGFLDELHQYDHRFFDTDKLAEIEALEQKLISKGLAEMTRMKQDPYYAAVRQRKRNIASQEILKEFKWSSIDKRPYVIFEQRPAGSVDSEVEKKSRANLERKLAIFQQLYSYFSETWAKPFRLSRHEEEPLTVLALRDHKAFLKYNELMGVPVPPDVIAYYEPENRWIVVYNGVETFGAETAEEKAILNDGTIFHEGTHQLVDAYVNKDRLGMSERISRTRWLDEGFCEFIGSVGLDHSPGHLHWKLEQRPDGRLEELQMWLDAKNSKLLSGLWKQLEMLGPMIKKAMEQAGIPLTGDGKLPNGLYLSIEDMVQCLTYAHVPPLVLKGVPPHLQGMLSPHVTSLMYAQSVVFWYFCKHHEGGKYWPNLMKYLKWEWGLSGETPPTVRDMNPAGSPAQYLGAFRTAFSNVDLDDLNKEFWLYVDQLSREALGKGIPSPPLPK